MKTNEEKLNEWAKMGVEEKIKWNGFNGFVNNETFRATSLFDTRRVKLQNGK